MAIATGVVSDLILLARHAAQQVTAQAGRAAVLNGRHDLELIETDVPGITLPVPGTLVTEDVRNLDRGPRHAEVLAR